MAASALSCEVAAVRAGDGRTLLHDPTGRFDADDAREALAALAARHPGGPALHQDTREAGLPAPFDHPGGVRAHYLLPLPAPVGGFLLLLHTDVAPRGFTRLCARLGETLVVAAGTLLGAAHQREQLTAQVRRDALTGLGSRTAWECALVTAQAAVDAGAGFAVVTLDVDNLKAVNDLHGHAAGDELLVSVAARLDRALAPGELAVRLGGDEFAVLVPDADADHAERRRHALHAAAERTCVAGVRALVSAGSAACGPGGHLADTVRQADQAMYETKRRRRADRAVEAARLRAVPVDPA